MLTGKVLHGYALPILESTATFLLAEEGYSSQSPQRGNRSSLLLSIR